MRLNILIGGKAGQGINKVSEIIAGTLAKNGWFTFNYKDYQSLIRGGHNFNILSISDSWIGSHESKIDGIIALDNKTIELHEQELKKNGFVVSFKDFEKENLGLNLNIALAGALIKILGIDEKLLVEEIKKELGKGAADAVELGYKSQKQKFSLKKLNNKISILSGTNGISNGAINSGINIYFSYPMTPATGVLHELAGKAKKHGFKVEQPENEIAVANMALGSSFAGAKTMVGTSGGGFDLMTEALSFQGQSEIPLVVYLAARPGPGTGVPTYTSQADLDVALRAGHGEFPRIVLAPGDPIECEELTNQAFFLAEKFNTLSIILSDKHLAESEFSLNKPADKTLKVEVKRKIPGEGIVKANSYEHDKQGETDESAKSAIAGAERRMKKYEDIKKEAEKFQMIKIHGKKDSKNLVIAWGSTKGAIIDAIREGELDCKFLQVLYLKPISGKIRAEMEKAKKIILVEENVTGQLGRLIREKTGLKIDEKNRILKYDARPFTSDELKEDIGRRIR